MHHKITFLGAAGTVTGSRFLMQLDERNYLVDCGLFQGGRKIKAKNWQPFPFPPDQIDAILLTHAHIDHAGYLPRLIAEGYNGPVFATEATCALLGLLLPDAAYLQEQEASYANKKGYSRHKPALPLFTSKDAQQALRHLKPVQFHQPLSIDGLTATWLPSGHILGAGIVQVDLETGNGSQRVVISGDLGRYESEIMKPPATIREADVVLIESTYGNRQHEDDSIEDVLSGLIRKVSQRNGVLLIPAFTVGRTQQILYWIRKLQDLGQVPDIPVFIDSPMAVEASHLYCKFGDDHNLDINLLMDEQQCPLKCRDTRFVRDVEESKQLNARPGPAVIISASGMCTGGRILHHLKWRLPDRRNTVLFVGYQAKGTRGRSLLEGAESIRIHGDRVPVRAEIAQLDALSAHADRDGLFRWLSEFVRPPSQTFIVHGEPDASQSFHKQIVEELGWTTFVPEEMDTFQL
jgi:metallo-beta-lactamase family protein